MSWSASTAARQMRWGLGSCGLKSSTNIQASGMGISLLASALPKSSYILSWMRQAFRSSLSRHKEVHMLGRKVRTGLSWWLVFCMALGMPLMPWAQEALAQNIPTTVKSDSLHTGATADGDGKTIAVTGYALATVQVIAAGGFDGTITWQVRQQKAAYGGLA